MKYSLDLSKTNIKASKRLLNHKFPFEIDEAGIVFILIERNVPKDIYNELINLYRVENLAPDDIERVRFKMTKIPTGSIVSKL